jgi:hypothetical protein
LQGIPGVENVLPLASGDLRCSKAGGWIVTFSSGDTVLIATQGGRSGPSGRRGAKGDNGANGANGGQRASTA